MTTTITTNSTASTIIIFDGIDLLGAVNINEKYITWMIVYTNAEILTIKCWDVGLVA